MDEQMKIKTNARKDGKPAGLMYPLLLTFKKKRGEDEKPSHSIDNKIITLYSFHHNAVTHHHDRSTIIAPPLFFEELVTMDSSYESNIDKVASDFIKTGRERNFKDASEITNVSEFILPTPPRIMFQSSSALKIQ
ncbi:hypothetical protein Tco_0834510 [Tanacetum coccineum]